MNSAPRTDCEPAFGNLYCPTNCVNCAAHPEIRLGQVACNKRKMRKQRCTSEALVARQFAWIEFGVFSVRFSKAAAVFCFSIIAVVVASN